MLSFLTFLFKAILCVFKSKRELIIQIQLHKKEIEILKRQKKKRLRLNHFDRVIFSILGRIGNIKDKISIVKPETVLRWQKQLIKRFWTFKTAKQFGRPPVKNEIKQLSDELLARRSERLGRKDSQYLAAARLDMSLIDKMHRIYSLTKRIAREVLPKELAVIE